jgi:type IV secretion system protein VirD4
MKLPFRTATLNPLDAIDKDDPEAVDHCRDLAEAIVIRTGEENDPHWADSAENLFATVIGAVVFYGPPGQRSLQEVVAIINHPDRFDHMRKIAVESDAWGGALSNMGGQLLHLQGEEKSSVLSTASRFLRFLNTPAVAASTRTSSFDVSAIRDRKMTVYLVLPPEHLRAQSGLLRLWITSLLHAAVKGGLQDEV